MKSIILIAFILASPLIEKNPNRMNVYDFKVESIDGGSIDFATLKGKKILIVNTASKCGYTKQYAQLEELHKAHGDKLVIIGFPANNFGGQEPGSNEEIAAFCEKNYGVSFRMAAKVSVKGTDQHELFKWLTSESNPDFTGDINWNFEKFLLDEQGRLIRRYRSGVDPMATDIVGAL